jgi:hypothetical protein
MHLLEDAKLACDSVPGSDSLSERELEAIYNRAVSETHVESRLTLHAEAWMEDVIAKAKQLVRTATDGKIHRATRRATPAF